MDVTATLCVPRDVDERSLAEWMEHHLDAGWLPQYHSYSIATDDAAVTVDLDQQGVGGLTAQHVRAAGFVPKAVLYVSTIGHHSGNAALVERVAAAVAEHLGGRVVALDPPVSGRA